MYGFAVILLCLMVAASGYLTSPFLVLWLAVAVFAGIFGWSGLLAMLIIANGLLVYGTLTLSPSKPDVLNAFLVLDLPILISYMLWHGNGALFSSVNNQSGGLHKSLKNEADKSNTVILSINDGVIMTAASGEVTLINPAAQRMLGWSVADALNLKIHSILKLEDEQGNVLPDANNPVVQALQSKQPQCHNAIIVTKSDKRFIAAVSVTPLDDGGSVTVFRDISKERAEEREQAEFISTASHEMRTPVAAIEGFLGLALNQKVAQIDDKAREYISKAHESAKYLGRLLKDLLEISKAEDGRLKHNITVIDAIKIAADTTESLRQNAEEKGLNLIFKPAGSRVKSGDLTIAPILFARADADHLRESLGNLIENAIKYTPSGSITVDVSANNQQVRFSVADTGIGIPPEDIDHLFQKFYRIDNSDTREIGGTGLGLYLTRRLVEGMHGRIGAESQHHKGSTFYIDLPRVDANQAQSIIQDDQRRAGIEAQKEEAIKAQSQPHFNQSTAAPQVAIPAPPPPVNWQQAPPQLSPAPMPQPQPKPSNPKQAPAAAQSLTAPQLVITKPQTQPTIKQPQPPRPPIPQPAAPQPQVPQPQTDRQPPKLTKPLLYTPMTSARPNTPIAQLERDPSNYTTRRQPPPQR